MSKESTCELRSSECRTEEIREHLCRKGINACPSYLICTIDASSNWCPAHYTTQCTNVCDTLVPRCKNGGTCMNISADDYRCICPQGFDGKDCDRDINECLRQPCQPIHYCENLFGNYSCNCKNGLSGQNCDLERCKMGPGDVVFLVDSSVSQGKDNFSKQLDFIKEFVKSIYIGQTFFRVSVITFSFNARVEFNLTKYLDNYTLLDAIDRIHYNPGVTNTGRALRAAREEVFPSNRTDVTKRVIILTDSMFSNKSDTIIQAKLLKDAGVTIVTIGIGSGVLHEELLEIASDYSDFFNVSTIDGLYSIQHKIGRCVYEGIKFE
ncbi:hypothetical protein CHS0354_018288 [Potamilus streckersoni]|uniref:Uncharacterized protein n=1 Tax=Potamilus streckersoni TaxID=2493646 RepID=A0AAE0WG85_9BIVA|nr:hypothetical protein CHS0354_018288 [Potamilus streckersoni]